jgi:hypothetical protein
MKKFFIGIFALVLLTLSTFALAQTKLDPNLYDENGFRKDQAPAVFIERSTSSTPQFSSTTPPSQTRPEPTVNQSNVIEGQLASCFDYYTFGSIKVNLTNNKDTYELGDAIRLSGQITNDNKYPITNLTVRARLVRDIPNPEYLRSEIITVEDFNIVENISLNAGESYDVRYSKVIPFNAPEGGYKLLFYAYNNDRFNQSGLSFTNDVVASRLSFDIEGNKPQHIYLDQTRITLNDKEHNVMAFITNHQKDTPININIPLVNPSDETEDMKVTYTLYKWDGLRTENIVDTKTENITVPANEEVQLTYTANNTDTSVYYLTITADNQTLKRDKSVYNIQTQSNIRFSVSGYDFPRINSFGVDRYPLKKGEEATLFTCFHNGASQDTQDELTIKTTLVDDKGKVISETEYQGKISGAISAIINKFTPKKDIANYTLKTTIIDSKGNVVDMIEDKYSCENFDPTMCPQKTTGNTGILISIIVLILIAIILLIIKLKHKIPTVVFTLLLFILPLLALPQESEGAVVTAPFKVHLYGSGADQSCGKNLFLGTDQLTGLLKGTFYKEVNLLKDGIKLSNTNPNTINIGESFAVQTSPTTGDWFAAGAWDDSPPMDGLNYSMQNLASLYGYGILEGETIQLCDPDEISYIFSDEAQQNMYDEYPEDVKQIFLEDLKKYPDQNISVSIPIEVGGVTILTDDPEEKILSCNENGCDAVGPGTVNIEIMFEKVEQELTQLKEICMRGYCWKYGDMWIDHFDNVTDNNSFEDKYGTKIAFGRAHAKTDNGFISQPFSFDSVDYTITVPPVKNNPPTVSCGNITTTDNSATINWKYSDPENDPQTYYKVLVNNYSDGEELINLVGDNSNTSVNVSGLEKNKTYIATITAEDSKGNEVENSAECLFETADSDPFELSCLISPTGNIYTNQEVTFSANVTGGKDPKSYLWNNDTSETSSTYKETFLSYGNNIQIPLEVTDGDDRLRKTTCEVNINQRSCGSATANPHEDAPTSNLCLPIDNPPVTELNNNWTWSCDGVDNLSGKGYTCEAAIITPSDAPDVTLKIQPKVSPSCVATFIDSKKLKDEQTCKLLGPNGLIQTYTTSTLADYEERMSATSTKVGTRGTYRLMCGEDADNLVLMNTDVCISNPTMIER